MPCFSYLDPDGPRKAALYRAMEQEQQRWVQQQEVALDNPFADPDTESDTESDVENENDTESDTGSDSGSDTINTVSLFDFIVVDDANARDVDKPTHNNPPLRCPRCEAFDHTGKLATALHRLNTEQLWCYRCKKYHKRGLFSAKQRDKKNWQRRCIGCQGKVPQVTVASMSWRRFSDYKRRMCKLKSHGRPGAVHLPARPCFRHQTPYFDLSSKDRRRIRDDHFLTVLRYEDMQKNCEMYPPGSLILTWVEHLFDLDDSDFVGGRIRLHKFRNILKKLERDPYREIELCPHMRFDDGFLLNKLTDHCCCFFDGDDASLENSPTCHGPEGCRCHKARLGMPSLRDKPNFHDKRRSHGGLIHSGFCPVCHVLISWRQSGKSIHLEMVNLLHSRSPTSPTWIRKLDPETWGIRDDAETKHVYWCPDKKCGTNFQWQALYKHLDCLYVMPDATKSLLQSQQRWKTVPVQTEGTMLSTTGEASAIKTPTPK